MEEPQGTDTRVGTRAKVDMVDYYWLGDQKIPLQKMSNKFYVMYESKNECEESASR
jgi:hypothetical protein